MKLRRQLLRDRVTVTPVTSGTAGEFEGEPVTVFAAVSTERALRRGDDEAVVTDRTVVALHPQSELVDVHPQSYVEAMTLAGEGYRVAFGGQESVVTKVVPVSQRGRLVRVDLVAE